MLTSHSRQTLTHLCRTLCSLSAQVALFFLSFLGFHTSTLLADVRFEKKEGSLTILVDEKPFAEYVWNDPKTTRPYFKQVRAPGGEVQITRHHPPLPTDLADHDTYHPGIWWGFGDIAGNDYWRMKARVVGGDFAEEPKGGKESGRFAVKDRLLVSASETVFCEQLCRYTILQRPAGILLLCEMTLRRDAGDFWLGDQEEMGLAVRLATPIATASGKGGRLLNSSRTTDLQQIRTQPSDWCDYSGPIDGKHGGILIMNNPKNFRRPWWHAVNTGLLVANPLGESELNGRGKRKENVLVKSGQPFELVYGVLVHLHKTADDFNPQAAYSDFLQVLATPDEKPKPKTLSQADLPRVPEGFSISVFAREPMIYKPTSMCFDSKGRLFLGQGPQYPENYPDTPTDSVYVIIDRDQDGVADEAKEFAKGFNSVQSLAWKGNDLYVANSPELTVVRDLDGDDVADEYVVVYTDLGNCEHAVHGLNWAPDGKLYMSKGNSKGHNQPEKTGYVAPRPFRELWDVEHPKGAPNGYPPKTFSPKDYRKTYHHWDDDWGREGGVLKCDPLGANLEIVSRGLRNPWDITADAGFNWLGTDNDQSQGDRFVMPFQGAHFGWGHPYSSHWTGDKHLPTVPVSGPVFPGSGTGIIYYDHEHFSPAYRQGFIVNDWLDGTFFFRPTWNGALMVPEGGTLQPFIRRGNGEMLYRPTDLEFAPDGSLYICGWGGNYRYDRGQEGSWIFRVTRGSSSSPGYRPNPKRSQSVAERSVEQLLEDLGPDTIPVWRVAAQDELVRRGASVGGVLQKALESNDLSLGQQTWAAWALGRMPHSDSTSDALFERAAGPSRQYSLNLRLQSIRILAHRARYLGNGLPPVVAQSLSDSEPRVRFEAVQAIHQAGAVEHLVPLIDRLAMEQDRLTYYASWIALRSLAPTERRKQLLHDRRERVRLAALLSLQHDFEITLEEVLTIAEQETDPEVQSWAMAFAANPRPPAKMPNTTIRVELEQSIPARELIERANKAADRPSLRRLYLTLISRSSFRGSEWKVLSNFYETLPDDDERALLLVPLTSSLVARDYMWEAFGGNERLRVAALDGWERMLNFAAHASPASEQQRKELGLISLATKRESNIEVNSAFLAEWLIGQLASCGPSDKRVPVAIGALSRSKVPDEWIPPETMDRVLSNVLEQRREAAIRSDVLAFLSKIGPSQISPTSKLWKVLRGLCQSPDPRLHHALVSISKRFNLDVDIPKLELATREGVLSRLPDANIDRGRDLFFDVSSGSGCMSCHRVAGQGFDFAPDLSGIGLRAKPEVIAESILAPSATITEGYSQQVITLEDGRTITGVVLRETGTELVVFKGDRAQQTVALRSITERRNSQVSAMPDGYRVLGNEQIADLVAYLMTLRHVRQ